MLSTLIQKLKKANWKPATGSRFDLSRANFTCDHKREMSLVVDHPLREERFAFHKCVVNELDSLLRRHVIDQISPSASYIAFARKELLTFYHTLGSPTLSPLDPEALIATRSSHVQKRWRRIAEQAMGTLFRRGEALVKTFIKYEKYGVDVLMSGKPPRAIQARGPLFTFRLARYLVPIEHLMWNWRPASNYHLRVFAKGRNARQRAADIRRMELWSDTKFVLVDHSKFDSRIHTEHLKLSHYFNSLFYRGTDRAELRNLMDCQLKNRCVTERGVFYEVDGRRMSGDIDTAKGNCEINYTVLRYLLRGIPSCIYLDGDDSVIAVPAKYVEQVVSAVKTCRDTGMESTVEVAQHFHQVEFCQSKPIFTNGAWTLMRNPIKAISNMCLMMRQPIEGVKERLATLGVGEMHASSGCPAIYPMAKKLAGLGKVNAAHFEYRHKLNKAIRPMEPDDDARATAWMAWDLDLADQQHDCTLCFGNAT